MDEIVVDDILSEKKRPKVKSGRKGKRVENELCKRLNNRFMQLFSEHPDWGRFCRSVGSGNRWGQKVHLSQVAKETLSSDITCPTNCLWAIESKGGYNDIDVYTALVGKNSEIDDFLNQVEEDAKRAGKKPMLVWKKDRKPRTVWIRTKDLPRTKLEYVLTYRNWSGFSFERLLEFDDEFFFSWT